MEGQQHTNKPKQTEFTAFYKETSKEIEEQKKVREEQKKRR